MENQRAAQHLNDDQFAELLAGTNQPAVRAHLSSCAKCSAEAERVSVALGSFEQQSRLWAERRAATAPAIDVRDVRLLSRFRGRLAWTVAAGLGVALAAGVGVTLHRDGGQLQIAAGEAPTVSPETLKADNELLLTIDGELRADTASELSTARSERVLPRVKTVKREANE